MTQMYLQKHHNTAFKQWNLLISRIIRLLPFIFLVESPRADEIAYFFALDSDLAALKETETSIRAVKIGSTDIQIFPLREHTIYATKMGVGNITTSINAATLFSKFPCDVAFSTGPAGSIANTIHPSEWFYIDLVVGYQRGTFARAGWNPAPEAKIALPTPGHIELDKLFRKAALASGDAFVAREADRERIREISECNLVDMNTFGLATACEAFSVPLVAIRVASDRANDSANDDFKKFVSEYDGEGGRLVREILQHLPPSPDSPNSYEHIRDLLSR